MISTKPVPSPPPFAGETCRVLSIIASGPSADRTAFSASFMSAPRNVWCCTGHPPRGSAGGGTGFEAHRLERPDRRVRLELPERQNRQVGATPLGERAQVAPNVGAGDGAGRPPARLHALDGGFQREAEPLRLLGVERAAAT